MFRYLSIIQHAADYYDALYARMKRYYLIMTGEFYNLINPNIVLFFFFFVTRIFNVRVAYCGNCVKFISFFAYVCIFGARNVRRRRRPIMNWRKILVERSKTKKRHSYQCSRVISWH